ncbi:RICIN domain-containing protein, partial [Nonomuraea sp. NPDC055795]
MYPPGTPGPFKIANHEDLGLCLDTTGNLGGDVYLGRCHSGDPGQRWGWWNGGWLIHLRSGYCLAAVTTGSGVRLAELQRCIDHRIQHWTHQNFYIRTTSTGSTECLSPRQPPPPPATSAPPPPTAPATPAD